MRPVADRDRIGVARHMAGEQCRNRHRRRHGPGQHRPVTGLIQTGVLTGVQHIDRRQPRLRIGGHRHQHPLETLDERLDRFLVEYVGAELHHPPNPVGRIGIGPVFGQREGEVHPCGVGVDRHLCDLQITQRQPGSRVAGVPGQVLPRQCHLNQRVMGQRSGGVEPLDEHLERHVLMFEGSQAAPTYLGQQLGNARIPGHVDPQHQGVDEEPDQLIERGVSAPGDREPHRHIGTRAEPRQQHRQGGLNHHETCRVVFAGHLAYPLLQLGRPVHGHIGATLIGHRGIGSICRQLHTPGMPASASSQYVSCAAMGLWVSPRSPNCARCHNV